MRALWEKFGACLILLAEGTLMDETGPPVNDLSDCPDM